MGDRPGSYGAKTLPHIHLFQTSLTNRSNHTHITG